MSSSTETPRLLRGVSSEHATGLRMPELSGSGWSRFGDDAAMGDEVTERLLEHLAESTRGAARAQGYAVGWAEGRREAEAAAATEAEQLALREADVAERREAEHAAAVAALREAAALLEQQVTHVCHRVDEQATGLALELTRELVGGALPDAGAHTVRRVLGVLPDHPVVRVRLSPSVAAEAGELRTHGVTVVPDPALGPADAVVEADDHVVDLRVGRALDRLREVLS